MIWSSMGTIQNKQLINLRFIVFLKMQSQSTWKKEKSFLEEEASNISVLKKEITKEAEIDVNVQTSISDKVDDLKQSATFLATKLQSEKHKNIELEMIIKHMRGMMEKQRLDASNSRGNLNSDDIVGLENRFKKLEYDLSQINGKVNRMSENLQDKKSKISQNRTQRVIDSGIFRNLEKELINSELTFKKLLIEKIKYQKEYQKITQEYQSLKDKAETYYCRKDSERTKNSKEMLPTEPEKQTIQYKKKFLEIDASRARQNRYTTFCKVDEELQQEQQKKIIFVKKMLVRTNLENTADLLHYFENIEQINEKYFNEINIYADQSNQIEKYLQQVASSKKQNRQRFTTERTSLTKKELNCISFKDKTQTISHLDKDIDCELQELIVLFESENFKTMLKGLGIETGSLVENGHVNFDQLKETLQLFDSSVNQYLREPVKVEQDKIGTNRESKGQKLEDMITKVRKNEQWLKVMKKEEFKEEYQKLLKNSTQKTVNRSVNKKKSFPLLKK